MNDARLRAPQAACAESENWPVLRPSGSDRVSENDSFAISAKPVIAAKAIESAAAIGSAVRGPARMG